MNHPVIRPFAMANAHAKIHDYRQGASAGEHWFAFHCPGCGYDHSFRTGGDAEPRWTWNGSIDKPSFQPSLMCNRNDPKSRCHCFVTEGRIQFLPDSWHGLKGETVDLPDWAGPEEDK